MRSLSKEIEVCVAVTLNDGLVMARSAHQYLKNHRSVIIFGQARLVEDEAEKPDGLTGGNVCDKLTQESPNRRHLHRRFVFLSYV